MDCWGGWLAEMRGPACRALPSLQVTPGLLAGVSSFVLVPATDTCWPLANQSPANPRPASNLQPSPLLPLTHLKEQV
jgi:hypothetical protein